MEKFLTLFTVLAVLSFSGNVNAHDKEKYFIANLSKCYEIKVEHKTGKITNKKSLGKEMICRVVDRENTKMLCIFGTSKEKFEEESLRKRDEDINTAYFEGENSKLYFYFKKENQEFGSVVQIYTKKEGLEKIKSSFCQGFGQFIKK